MDLSISHSSLRLPATIRRPFKASSKDSRLFLSPIKPRITQDIKSSSNFPTATCSSSSSTTNKLTLPPGLYGESMFSKPLLFGQHDRNSVRASAQAQAEGSDSVPLANSQVGLSVPDSVFAKVTRFLYTCYKFARPYAMRQSIISTVCLYARVLVENPQLFKWSLLLKAFPGLIAVFLAYTYYNGTNQIFDIDIDKVNKPYLPLPAGELTLKQAWYLVIFDIVAGLSILRLMNADKITTILYCLGLFFCTLYSAPPFRFKGSSLATVIVIPLITGVIQNIGILYTSQVSLGLPFWWSPPVVFITAFSTLFFVIISITKDIPDVEGDLKHNIRTFAAMFGAKNIAVAAMGLLLINYLAPIAAAFYLPQAFNLKVLLPSHLIMSVWSIFEWRKMVKENYNQESSTNFFQFLWTLLMIEFLLFPFI
uniref:Prenyltransferase n=1 Tax=Ficus carica TaxID=3494 RepID=A0A6S4PSN9_FICCA|nr:prenyltransferase [Ficus carica]